MKLGNSDRVLSVRVCVCVCVYLPIMERTNKSKKE